MSNQVEIGSVRQVKSEIFWNENFWVKILLDSKFCWIKNFVGPKIILNLKFSLQLLFLTSNLIKSFGHKFVFINFVVTTPTTTHHTTTPTQAHNCGWIEHRNDCANPPPPTPPQKLNGSLQERHINNRINSLQEPQNNIY